MDLPFNANKPTIMHIDLDSCFATITQQAYIHLRGKPLVVAAYATPYGCVLSPSIEAKRFGIKTGMTVRQAQLLCPDVIARVPDPPMIRDVHQKFKKIFNDYSPSVTPKSIDEAIIDFTGLESFLKRDLVSIGQEIKLRMRREIGEWISGTVGIGANRFHAKTAASFNKPDGLFVISPHNIREVFSKMTLTDINGINVRYQARLNMYGIFTPLQFLDSPLDVLQKQVFKSVGGYYWYLRLRGWEIDAIDFQRKSYGQDYALGKFTTDPAELSAILMKLCEKMGRRLRKAGKAAEGVHIACVFSDFTHWHIGRRVERQLYTSQELYKHIQRLFNGRPEKDKAVRKLAVSCYDLVPCAKSQMTLFDTEPDRSHELSDALDKINDRYGEYVITPALMLSAKDLIEDRIAFGRVKEL